MEKRNEEGKNELGKEIEIEIPNCKLHLFHNENINQSYITRVQNYIKNFIWRKYARKIWTFKGKFT